MRMPGLRETTLSWTPHRAFANACGYLLLQAHTHCFHAMCAFHAHSAHALHQLAGRVRVSISDVHIHGGDAVFQFFAAIVAPQDFSGQLVEPAAKKCQAWRFPLCQEAYRRPLLGPRRPPVEAP